MRPPALPPPARSWRPFLFAAVIIAHVAGMGLILSGAPLAGLVSFALSHMTLFWGAVAPCSRLYGPVVRRFDTSRREVWLTVDDGPSDDTAAILDLLDTYRARATFFLVAEQARKYPGMARAIIERGHQVGNHSLDHPAASFWIATPAAMRRQIGECQTVLERITGKRPRLFRAVVGMNGPFVTPELRRHGLRQIGWSARGYDSIETDPERVVARISRRLQPGAILLVHEGCGHGNSVAIVRRLLETLQSQAYDCVIPRQAPAGRVRADQPAIER